VTTSSADASWIPEQWTFHDRKVAERFDTHVRESLPWYDLATLGVAHFVRAYLPDGGRVLDVGASTGNIGRAIADLLSERDATLVAVDNSVEMMERYDAPGEPVIADIVDFDPPDCDVAVLFLVLMFIDPKRRRGIVERIGRSVRPGGAIIVVDRLPNPEGYLGETIHRLTLRQKKEAGVPLAEIAEKELSLIGRQRPVSPYLFDDWTEWLRIGEFAGFIRPVSEVGDEDRDLTLATFHPLERDLGDNRS
jgi:tRNA (cmo5U34)-methyltransferase